MDGYVCKELVDGVCSVWVMSGGISGVGDIVKPFGAGFAVIISAWSGGYFISVVTDMIGRIKL